MKRSRLGKTVVGGLAVGQAAMGQEKPVPADVGDLDKGAVKRALKKPNSPCAGRTYARKPKCAARRSAPPRHESPFRQSAPATSTEDVS